MKFIVQYIYKVSQKSTKKKESRRPLSHISEDSKPAIEQTKQASYLHLFIFIYLPSVVGVLK